MNARQPASRDDYLGAFRRACRTLPGQGLDWLQEVRAEAIGRFAQQGFPTQRDEDWKYTSVAAIENARFNVLPFASAVHLAPCIEAHALPGCRLLVFVNGRFEPGLCRLGRLPDGIEITSLAYRLDRDPQGLEEVLSLSHPASAFADLNLAFAADGAYVSLGPDRHLEEALQILFIVTEDSSAIQPRNLIFAAQGSSASIVEHHVTLGEKTHFTNAVSDIRLAPGAAIAHYKLQQESPSAFHVAAINVLQSAGSRFISGSVALGAALSRVGIHVALQAEAATCELQGLYVSDGRQHVDHHTRIDHLAPRCRSREIYKGVLDGASRAVFNGRVVVHPDAQGSDATQGNHNLLLSDHVEIDTKPQLEIWADDVQCSHGATVGQLDDDQVFYLRSRGIDLARARAMLTLGFVREIVDLVSIPSLQERLGGLLRAKLRRH